MNIQFPIATGTARVECTFGPNAAKTYKALQTIFGTNGAIKGTFYGRAVDKAGDTIFAESGLPLLGFHGAQFTLDVDGETIYATALAEPAWFIRFEVDT